MQLAIKAEGFLRTDRRDSHRGAGGLPPPRRRIDLRKPPHANQQSACKKEGDHRFALGS
jgi:hypothetical protein